MRLTLLNSMIGNAGFGIVRKTEVVGETSNNSALYKTRSEIKAIVKTRWWVDQRVDHVFYLIIYPTGSDKCYRQDKGPF